MAKAEQQNLQEIFHQSHLKIPRYQRSYAWTESEVSDLLDDIEYVIAREHEIGDARDVVHYFGTVVLDDDGQRSSPEPNDWTIYKVVDGQQRLTTTSLLVGCICEELKNLQGVVNIDTSKQNSPEELYEMYRSTYIKYRNKDNGRRFTPASLTKKAYDKLVISEKDPEDVLEKRERILPAKRLAEAKVEIQSWLSDKRDEHLDAEIEEATQDDLRSYFNFLYDVLSAINNIFEVTKYEVDSAAEAGRLFEVVNDRGKDLTTAEKVKSHLLYCAGEVDQLDSEAIAREFNEAVETITINGGDEEEVDQFIDRHWEMFTGETNRKRPRSKINGLHRRIKQIDRYASFNRHDDDLANWVETYVESLTDAADAFFNIYDPTRLADQYDDLDDTTLNKLQAIDTCGAASTFRPVLMAGYLQLDVTGSQFSDLVDVCETFAFRAFEIINRSTMLLRRQLKRESHRLYIADWTEQDVQDLFGETTLDETYDEIDDAVHHIIKGIDQATGKQAPESEVIDHLTRKDIFDGSFTTGWGGFGSKTTTILYLLYEYERSLRAEQGVTGLHSLVDFGSFEDDAEVEHIAPQNPEDGEFLANHRHNVNRLGNQAFLWPEDNQTAGNGSYAEKYKEVYDGSKIALLEELPDASNGWSVTDIDVREERLVDFVLERWAGKTTGRVAIQGEVSNEMKAKIRADVQQHYNETGTESRKLPTIEFISAEDYDVNEEGYTRQKNCSTCGGQTMEIVDDDYQCVCGTNIRKPNYEIKECTKS